MKQTLPFDINVLADTYHYLAYPYGIIKANFNDEQYSNSIFKHCSSLIWYGSDSPTQLAFDSYYFTWWEHFIKEEIDNSFIIAQENRLVDYVISCVNGGKYLYICVDDYYIPNRSCYMKRHFKHDMLIYGYDEAKQQFMIAGYNNKGHYSKDSLCFRDFVQANPEDFVLLTVNKEYILEYTRDDYKKLIEKYIIPNEKDKGINSCNRLLEFVNEIKNTSDLYDVKPFIILLKHKYVMHMLMNKIVENVPNNLFYNKYLEQFDLCNKIKFLMLKYGLTKDDNVLEDVKMMISESIELDRYCLLHI